MFEENRIKRYLQLVKDIKKEYKLIYIHVHPLEIIFNTLKYVPNSQNNNIYSIHNSKYIPPKIGPFKIEQYNKVNRVDNDGIMNKFALMKINKSYSHIGLKVISDHMKLSGIDSVMLLPVAQSNESANDQMDIITKIYGTNGKFVYAYSIPNSIINENILDVVKESVRRFNIKALKLHPNITGINLSSKTGIQRVEAILSVSNEMQLPLIIHGGRSPVIKNKDTSEYSIIKNLIKVDWGISKETVVIAHAGAFGCEVEEYENDVFPILKKMLSHFSNIMVDISGLDINILLKVLKHINADRIIFGSDALYNMQWIYTVMLLYALDELYDSVEEKFIQIVSLNPRKYVLKELEVI